MTTRRMGAATPPHAPRGARPSLGWRTLIIAIAVVASMSACSSGDDSAISPKYASFLGPGFIQSVATDAWIEDIADSSEGRIRIDHIVGEALLSAPDSLAGIASGRAPMGLVSPMYHPGELPLSQIIALPYTTSNLPALMKTNAELLKSNDALMAEYRERGVHPMFWAVSPPMMMGCKNEVRTAEDFAGLKVRATATIAEVLKRLKASPVALPVNEVRDALDRGVIDCWAALSIDVVADIGLHEVTPYLYDIEYGTYSTGIGVADLDFWEDLSSSDRQLIEQASDNLVQGYTERLDEVSKQACDKILAGGRKVRKLPASALEPMRALAESLGRDAFLEGAGGEGQAYLDEYLRVLQQYEKDDSSYASSLTACVERS